MKKYQELSRARMQLYDFKVAFRRLEETHQPKRRTQELRQLIDILQTCINRACDAFEGGRILEVLINEYVPMHLPGVMPEVPPEHRTEFESTRRAMEQGREFSNSPEFRSWLAEALDEGFDPF
jgi:hypothetical protein